MRPRSLSTQMALLVAVALFVAQSINFALLLQGRRQLREQQVIGPAVARIVEANERIALGRPPGPFPSPGSVRLERTNPIAADGWRARGIAEPLRRELAEAGLVVGRIDTQIRRIDPRDERWAHMGHRRARHFARMGAELVLAVERPGGGWLVLSAPWFRTDGLLVWQLIGQTVVLYVIVLIPMLWAARRISRPLASLAAAAQSFRPGEPGDPLPERGPQDLRAVTAAFNALRLRVTAMIDEKDRMLGAIGHDLRTPLAALRVRVESVPDEGDRARMAETIAEMNRTLDDILSLARIGRPSEGVTEVDLSALVDAVVEDFRDLGADVTFTPGDRLTLWLRPSLMRRAVRNLIENAVKYGGAAEVRLESGADQVEIMVCDRGPGIAADQLDTVFDPFTRLESSRNRDTGGIGLGLALARAIVRDAGGEIALRNRDGGGLEAAIALPRRVSPRGG